MIGTYGEQCIPSDAYARVRAGFYSAPLLGSFCIFAAAVLAREDITLPARWRLAAQLALTALVLATLSRAEIGFAAALMIRAAYGRRRRCGARRHRHGRRQSGGAERQGERDREGEAVRHLVVQGSAASITGRPSCPAGGGRVVSDRNAPRSYAA